MFALAMMPKVGDLMVQQNLSLPGTYNNLDDFVTELLIRSCGASWTQLVDDMGAIELEEQFLTTDVHVVVPTSRANVLWRRVLLWLLPDVHTFWSSLPRHSKGLQPLQRQNLGPRY